MVNELILKCNLLTPRLSSFKLVSSDIIGLLYSNILRVKPFNLKQDEKQRYQNMIDHLANVLNTDVGHLNSDGMASKDPKQLCFLLEILSAILDAQNTSITSSESESRCCDACQPCTGRFPPPVTGRCPLCPPSYQSSYQRDFSPDSCCKSVNSCSHPSSVSSCDCPDLDHSSSSCSCTCSHCYYPTTSSTSPALVLDEERFNRILQKQRDSRSRTKHPVILRHRTGRTPVRPVVRQHTNVKQTKLPEPPQDIQSLMAKFKLAKEDAFALELGYRLHEALRLEDETKKIERQIDQFYRMKRSPSKSKSAIHVLTPSKSNAKSTTSSKATTPKKVFNPSRFQSKSPAKTYTLSPKSVGTTKTDDLNNMMKKSSSLESFLGMFAGDSFPPETKKKLKIMEAKHNLMINNLRSEMKNKESKSCLLLKEAIDAEVKKSELLRKEIERLNKLKERKMSEIDLLDQNVAIKEYRTEKAKVHQMVKDYQREVASKFMAVQSKQEQLLKDELEDRMREEKVETLRMKNIMKEREAKDLSEKKKLLKAFDGMYQSKFDSVKDKLQEVEKDVRNRRRSNNQLLNEIKERLKNELKVM